MAEFNPETGQWDEGFELPDKLFELLEEFRINESQWTGSYNTYMEYIPDPNPIRGFTGGLVGFDSVQSDLYSLIEYYKDPPKPLTEEEKVAQTIKQASWQKVPDTDMTIKHYTAPARFKIHYDGYVSSITK